MNKNEFKNELTAIYRRLSDVKRARDMVQRLSKRIRESESNPRLPEDGLTWLVTKLNEDCKQLKLSYNNVCDGNDRLSKLNKAKAATIATQHRLIAELKAKNDNQTKMIRNIIRRVDHLKWGE